MESQTSVWRACRPFFFLDLDLDDRSINTRTREIPTAEVKAKVRYKIIRIFGNIQKARSCQLERKNLLGFFTLKRDFDSILTVLSSFLSSLLANRKNSNYSGVTEVEKNFFTTKFTGAPKIEIFSSQRALKIRCANFFPFILSSVEY